MKFSFPTTPDVTLKAIMSELSNFANRNVDLRQNCKVAALTVTFDVSPGTEKRVEHGLSVIPFMYVYNVDDDAVVYDSRRTAWDTSYIYLKCNKQDVSVRFLMLG